MVKISELYICGHFLIEDAWSFYRKCKNRLMVVGYQCRASHEENQQVVGSEGGIEEDRSYALRDKQTISSDEHNVLGVN